MFKQFNQLLNIFSHVVCAHQEIDRMQLGGMGRCGRWRRGCGFRNGLWLGHRSDRRGSIARLWQGQVRNRAGEEERVQNVSEEWKPDTDATGSQPGIVQFVVLRGRLRTGKPKQMDSGVRYAGTFSGLSIPCESWFQTSNEIMEGVAQNLSNSVVHRKIDVQKYCGVCIIETKPLDGSLEDFFHIGAG